MSDTFIDWKRRRWAGLVAVTCALLLAACATTQQADLKSAQVRPTSAKLTRGAEGQAALRYVNPAADWTRYKKVIIRPVTFWGDEQWNVSTENRRMLADYFSQSLEEELAKKFQIVDQPGPDVLTLQVEVTDVEAATPALRTITMVVPQARLLAMLKRAVTGSYPFVGGAQAEFKITDSMTGEILAVGVDRRIGGGAISTAAQWHWGDAENAMREWAKLAAERLLVSTTGAAKRG